MRFTPRQIVVRAQEAAHLLLATLDHEAYVPHFLLAYANDHDRPGLITQPMLYRDLMGSVRRESILAMVIHLDSILPRRFGLDAAAKLAEKAGGKAGLVRGDAKTGIAKAGHGSKAGKVGKGAAHAKKLAKLTAKQRAAAKKREAEIAAAAAKQAREAARAAAAGEASLDLFREEFFVELGRAMRWSDSDFAEFARDFDLYQAIAERESRAPQSRGSKASVSGAFVDRCGLLVDPSMLEQARRAAAQFQSRLNGATEQVLKRVFAVRREN
jgi:hypothetical protein